MFNNIRLYAIKDAHVGFGTPICEINDDVAKRNFAFQMSHGQLKEQAKDFDLYFIGTMDVSSGFITCDSLPTLVISGVDASVLY